MSENSVSIANAKVDDTNGKPQVDLLIVAEHFVPEHVYNDATQYLVEHGADVNAKDDRGYTPLHWAVYRDNIKVLKYLVKHGAKINVQDERGHTPLYWAVHENNVEMLEYLIEHGAEVDIQDKRGKTPLWFAALLADKDAFEYLIEHGAINTNEIKALYQSIIGNFNEAIEYCEQGLKLAPQNHDLLFRKGYSLRQLYRFAEAEETFALAEENEPGNVFVIEHLVYLKRCQKKFEEALALCDQISLFDNTESHGYIFFYYIDILISLNRVDEAMELLRQAIEKYPDQAASYALLAELYEKRNEPELAKKYYESGLEKPFAKLWEPEEYYNLFHGVILAELGDHKTAIAWIFEHQSARGQAKPYSWSDYWLARSYFALGQMEEARKHADRAIQCLTITNDWQSRIRHCRELIEKLGGD